MAHTVSCRRCPFSTYAHNEENAEAIAAIHVQDCIGGADREHIFVSDGGLHKGRHLGWVDLDWATDQVRHQLRQVNEDGKDAEQALQDVDDAFAFPDDDLRGSLRWVDKHLFHRVLELVRHAEVKPGDLDGGGDEV